MQPKDEHVIVVLDGSLAREIREVRAGLHPHVEPSALQERILAVVYQAVDDQEGLFKRDNAATLTRRLRPSESDVARALTAAKRLERS